MKISEEELAAFADDELEGERESRVAQAVAADPALARKVEQHRALRTRLGSHFAPILDQSPPAKLTELLRPDERVADLSEARKRRTTRQSPVHWGWIAGPALAASLALIVFLPRGGPSAGGYVQPELAESLETQLASAQAQGAETRILLSFQREDGQYCRAFSASETSGIACRDDAGWALVAQTGGSEAEGSEFRQAASSVDDLLAAAQDMAAGPALDAAAEQAARDAGWMDD